MTVEFVTPGEPRFAHVVTTTIGELLLVSDGHSLTELRLPAFGPWPGVERDAPKAGTLIFDALEQIDGYLRGAIRAFSIPLAPTGTEFQCSVWRALAAIPYGETRSYGEVAAAVGRPKAARAIGAANHVNPLAIIVPCHRVIGTSGALVGYAGGLALKTELLALEARGVFKEVATR